VAKRPTKSVRLWEPDNQLHTWRIRWQKMPKGVYGECDWVTRTIRMNYRLRSGETIWRTILHECAHVAFGPNVAESGIDAIESNYVTGKRAIDG